MPESFIENFQLSSDYESLDEKVEYFENFGDINIRSQYFIKIDHFYDLQDTLQENCTLSLDKLALIYCENPSRTANTMVVFTFEEFL